MALGAVAAGAVFVLRDALVPFFLAFVVAYVFVPWVDLMERRLRLPRALGTLLVFLILTVIGALLVVGVIPVLERQTLSLLAKLPAALVRLRDQGLPMLTSLPILSNLLEHGTGTPGVPLTAQATLDQLSIWLSEVGPALLHRAAGAALWAATGTMHVVVQILGTAIIPVLVFYMMVDFRQIAPWLRARFPSALRPLLDERLPRIDRMLGEYLRGQLTVGLILSGVYGIGLTLAGVEAALAIGLLAGLGNMVPYLGFVLGLTLALLVVLLTHFDLAHMLYVLAVFVGVQSLDNFLISPRIVGERVGLHPVAIIFALFVGGQAFGFLGVLLGVPAAICIKAFMEPVSAPAPAVASPPAA